MASKIVLVFSMLILIPTLGSAYGGSRRAELGKGGSRPPILLTTNSSDLDAASRDFGKQTQARPKAVLYPASVKEIAKLIKSANHGMSGFLVSARGNGHSVNGQSLTSTGTVVDLSRKHNKILNETEIYWPRVNVKEKYVDVWGGELWIDLLNATLKFGLAPRTWTDYLYLTVGGTLSNAGLSGQTYNFGPQISNVYELEVVTGKGEIVTCSRTKNSELFYGALGGLGQFGIITRARIPLELSPERVKWITVTYTSFYTFTKDQEYLISLHDKPSSERFDYVEGFVAYNHSASDPIVYSLEIVKNYDKSSAGTVDQEVEALLRKLEYIPNSESRQDVPYIDFLDRVHTNELILRSKGLWDVPHPWINLFVPKSKVAEFNEGVWEAETSAVTPDEDIFYAISLLWSASGGSQTLDYLQRQNRQILDFCKNAKLNVKEYIPYYTSVEEWKAHFGPQKWDQLSKRKLQFDPKHILASGQHIFNPILAH
uniref:cytokinin dehydrogenase n=1 Tax=Kalanchoe fedtschenkoi TaxID=63787 RepID=A0A7N0V666_KALFE